MKARSAWDDVGTQKLTILARSTDLNAIENIFHIVKQKFHQNSLDQLITGENFAALSPRVNTTLKLIPTDVVDRTILSMGKRINKIIKLKGQRNKNYFFTWKYFQMH